MHADAATRRASLSQPHTESRDPPPTTAAMNRITAVGAARVDLAGNIGKEEDPQKSGTVVSKRERSIIERIPGIKMGRRGYMIRTGPEPESDPSDSSEGFDPFKRDRPLKRHPAKKPRVSSGDGQSSRLAKLASIPSSFSENKPFLTKPKAKGDDSELWPPLRARPRPNRREMDPTMYSLGYAAVPAKHADSGPSPTTKDVDAPKPIVNVLESVVKAERENSPRLEPESAPLPPVLSDVKREEPEDVPVS
jgi:hypothetical protein